MGTVPQNSSLSTTLFCILTVQISKDNTFVKLNFILIPSLHCSFRAVIWKFKLTSLKIGELLYFFLGAWDYSVRCNQVYLSKDWLDHKRWEKKGSQWVTGCRNQQHCTVVKGSKTERYKYATSARQKAILSIFQASSGVPCPTLGTLVEDRCLHLAGAQRAPRRILSISQMRKTREENKIIPAKNVETAVKRKETKYSFCSIHHKGTWIN